MGFKVRCLLSIPERNAGFFQSPFRLDLSIRQIFSDPLNVPAQNLKQKCACSPTPTKPVKQGRPPPLYFDNVLTMPNNMVRLDIGFGFKKPMPPDKCKEWHQETLAPRIVLPSFISSYFHQIKSAH